MTAPEKQIELLPQENWEKTSFGKFIKWVLTVGRYIVVFTELVVIIAFISRFKLDHDLSGLHEEIEEKQTIISSSQDFEHEFRLLQTKLGHINQVEKSQATNRHLLSRLIPLMPIDVVFSSFTVNKNNLSINGASLSEYGLASFVDNLKGSLYFSDLILSNVSTDKNKTTGIQFGLNAQYSEETETKNE